MHNITPPVLDELRAAMRAWTSGIAILTVAHGEQRHGVTVNSFMSVSLEPPTIAVSLQIKSRAYDLVQQTRAFGLTLLAAQQQELADLFAGRTPTADRFNGVPTATLITGAPLIIGGLAWLDCRATQFINSGTNDLIVADVVAAHSAETSKPLIYHDRAYWQIEKR